MLALAKFAAIRSNRGGSGAVQSIADLFAVNTWTGDGASETITNGIDLSSLGGLVMIRRRDSTGNTQFFDTVRGATKYVTTNLTTAEGTDANSLTAFNSNGYTLGSATAVNANTGTFVGWSFAKAAGFFDIQYYTGDGVGTGQAIAHALGSTPGFIFAKVVSTTGAGVMWHSECPGESVLSNASTQYVTTNIETRFGDNTSHVAPTSSTITVGSSLNASGETYVLYIFGHGDLIQCGSYIGNGSASGPSVNLGFEPQAIWYKGADSTGRNAFTADTARGWASGIDPTTTTNSNIAESTSLDFSDPTATGFDIKTSGTGQNASGEEYVYMAVKAA